MNTIGTQRGVRHVLHLVDTLEMGGAERVAVNLVNVLPRERYKCSLATTRRDGPLAEIVAPDVERLRLERTTRFDVEAVRTLVTFIQQQRVDLLHAHGTALFVARLAAAFAHHPAIIWHDHFGRYMVEERPVWAYRWGTMGIGGVIAVNASLADWARGRLGVPGDRVWYVPNFVTSSSSVGSPQVADLPGTRESRVICVANLRPQKDHHTLIAGMASVVARCPSAHLLLVGDTPDPQYLQAIRDDIVRRGLGPHVSLLGPRRDVPALLRACAAGVLSSMSEGLPLALIEYGMAGLGTVATDVGQCAAIVDRGRLGLVVPPRAPEQLADAIVSLLLAPGRCAMLGRAFQAAVTASHGPAEGARRICEIYEQVIGATPSRTH